MRGSVTGLPARLASGGRRPSCPLLFLRLRGPGRGRRGTAVLTGLPEGRLVWLCVEFVSLCDEMEVRTPGFSVPGRAP